MIIAKPASKIDEALIREGWEALARKLGMAKATHFLFTFECGEGDLSLDEIYRTVKEEKKSRLAFLPN